MWIIYGAVASLERPYGLQNVIIADGVSLLISSLMVWFLYYYKEGITKKTKIKVAVVLISLLTISATIIFVWYYEEKARVSSNLAIVFSMIIPAFTTFAFSPQLYMSIKTKNWKGVSPWLYVLFTVNNIFWILFWISTIVISSQEGKSFTDIIGALIWQTISFTLYFYQLLSTIYYNSKYYNIKQKQMVI